MITCLHGFLGLPSDWDFLRDAGFAIETPPLDAIPVRGDILLGYSMGGRLAVQALLNGARYRRAIIVSARVSEAEAGRREADERWAQRFESEEWPSLMKAWNAQPVFGGRTMARRESDFDRRSLARALREWSPAVMPPVASRLHEITIPVLWIAGELDTKYVAEATKAVELSPSGEMWICEGAGHRVPWEQPAKFIERIRRLE